MRLFVAIELDEAARQAIAAEQARLKGACSEGERSSLRWVKPDHIHLTLAFLGETTEARTRLAIDVMAPPMAGGAFVIGFGGLGVFPPHGDPRVLWVGLARGSREVAALRRQVVERLARIDIVLEDRFHPHLTLARWRRAGRRGRPRVASLGRPGELFQQRVAEVALLESRLSPAGPTHTALGRTRLEAIPLPPLQSE